MNYNQKKIEELTRKMNGATEQEKEQLLAEIDKLRTSDDLNENEKELLAQLFDSYGHPAIAVGIRDGTIKPTPALLEKYTEAGIIQKDNLRDDLKRQLDEAESRLKRLLIRCEQFAEDNNITEE